MKTKMKRKNVVILVIVILAIAIGMLFRYEMTKTQFSLGYPNGNTAGNLYNAGLFCESNGTIFFSNPADNHKLYSMNSSGGDVKKLCDDVASYINANDNYVFYVRDNGSLDSQFSFLKWNNNSLCRINRNGKGEVKILDNDPCLYSSLIGNYIYYIHYDTETASTLYKVRIDGKEKKSLANQPYFTCSTEERYMYYNGLDMDHNIYRLDSTTDSASIIYQGNCWQPTVTGNTAYFMDCEDNYSLAVVDLTTGEKKTLIPDRLDCYCVAGNYVYYQVNSKDTPQLRRIMTDGTGEEVVADGNYTSINATSSYVYFYSFSNDLQCYCTPTNGPVNVTPFLP